jgi:propanol-preferring alcohol dehydrogenase
MMQAMRIHQQGPVTDVRLQHDRVAIPAPGPGEIQVQVRYCGVCHTDLHILEGDLHPPHLPLIPGHQAVGTVSALGARVDRWQIGDRVGIPWLHAADGTCPFCQRGQENLCPNARFTGFHVDGGFAEYLLAAADYALSLPEQIGDLQAAPLLCAGIIGYRSLRQAELQPGERLGLVGFGASAHLAIQVANYWNCTTYVFTRSPAHRQHARELGAVFAGGIEDEIDQPIDRAVIFAPAGSLVPQVLSKLRSGGTLAINAIHMSPIPEMDYQLIYGERTLRSVANATVQDGVEFLELAARIPLQADVTTYPLDAAQQALLDIKHSRLNGEAVLAMPAG